MKRITPFVFAVALLCGCASVRYEQTKPDGSKVAFKGHSLFSNTTWKGLAVDGTTKTTSTGLRLTAGSTEPNPESITATGSALGELIGAAAATAAKSTVKP